MEVFLERKERQLPGIQMPHPLLKRQKLHHRGIQRGKSVKNNEPRVLAIRVGIHLEQRTIKQPLVTHSETLLEAVGIKVHRDILEETLSGDLTIRPIFDTLPEVRLKEGTTRSRRDILALIHLEDKNIK